MLLKLDPHMTVSQVPACQTSLNLIHDACNADVKIACARLYGFIE